MLIPPGRVGSVDLEVHLQVALGGEDSTIVLTLEWSLSSVGAVMHFEGALAA